MRSLLLLAGAVGVAGPAEAHGTLPGGGGFQAGLAHPFVALEHLLLLIGLGLLLGRHALPLRRTSAAVLGAGVCAGLYLGVRGVGWAHVPVAILAMGLCVGLLLAAALRLPGAVLVAVALVAGLAVGADTDVLSAAGAGLATIVPGLGVLAGVFLIVLNLAALAAAARGQVAVIGLRVAGSWIAAATLMVLALQVRRLTEGG